MPVVERTISAPAPARRSSPRDRPPLAIRSFVGLIGLGAMLTTVALLLSDRAPGVVRMVFGDRVRRLWERIDASERVDLPAASELPSPDFVIHVGIWAVVAGLVGLTVWTWRGLALSALVLAALSALLELAQGRYATTRAVEASDAVGNLVGIGLGTVAAAACYVVWSALAGLARLVSDGRTVRSAADRRPSTR